MDSDGLIRVKLAGLPCGDYSLTPVVRHRNTQDSILILEDDFPISIVDVPPIDRRNTGRYEGNGDVAKVNLNRIIFRAQSPSQVIVFHDGEAVSGEELIINYIQLKPYLE